MTVYRTRDKVHEEHTILATLCMGKGHYNTDDSAERVNDKPIRVQKSYTTEGGHISEETLVFSKSLIYCMVSFDICQAV